MNKLSIKEIALFGILGGIMYAQKAVLASLPNIHLGALLIIAYTVVFRAKALYPIYVYILLEGLFGGFTTWWVPYLYVWTILWGVVMLLPKDLPEKRYGTIVYMIVGGLHGLLFGVIFAPAQALMFGLNFEATLAWIAAGFTFDAIHCASNFVVCSLVIPVVNILKKIKRNSQI